MSELEKDIARRAADFDPLALIRVLTEAGYEKEEILFRSNSTDASAVSLVTSIEFHSLPPRRVVVTMNLGLLGPQSPLPSYFKHLLVSGEVDEAAFLEFLHFFDHNLIREQLEASEPELSTRVFANFDQTKRDYLRLMGLGSPTTLHWLFKLVFPELGVRVGQGTMNRIVPLDGIRLASSRLGGSGVMGGRARVPVRGFFVTLYCDEEHSDFGHPWVEEVRRRLDTLAFPPLADASLDLRISLVIRSEKVFARLSHESYLGFDRIRGGQRRNREVLVWNGEVTPASRCLQGDAVQVRRRARPS
ncbi:MAG: type VI secretion system baseplate subunit TssG [Planctomycetes bacterium]|nr:type VI secretion system baseplate subunit TssG [Planctomycetota bacterium]